MWDVSPIEFDTYEFNDGTRPLTLTSAVRVS